MKKLKELLSKISKGKKKIIIISVVIIIILAIIIISVISSSGKIPTSSEIDKKLWLASYTYRAYFYQFDNGECSYVETNGSLGSVLEQKDGTYEIKKDGIHIYYEDGTEDIVNYEYDKNGKLTLKDGEMVLEDKTSLLFNFSRSLLLARIKYNLPLVASSRSIVYRLPPTSFISESAIKEFGV